MTIAAVEFIRTITKGTELDVIIWVRDAPNSFHHQNSAISLSILLFQNELNVIEIATVYGNKTFAENTTDPATKDSIIALWELVQKKCSISTSVYPQLTEVIDNLIKKGPVASPASVFFSYFSGNWDLDYTHGSEKITVEPDGKYLIRESQGICHPKPKHHFNLNVLGYDSDSKTFEVAKNDLYGKVRQIELLRQVNDQFVGVAKSDGHKVVYKRPFRL